MTPANSGPIDPDAFVADDRPRCQWAQGPWNVPYHDTEWGVPEHDDRTHFEFLVLEGAQAGLSWLTILKKREGYRRLFADFDAEKVARFSPKRIDKWPEIMLMIVEGTKNGEILRGFWPEST